MSHSFFSGENIVDEPQITGFGINADDRRSFIDNDAPGILRVICASNQQIAEHDPELATILHYTRGLNAFDSRRQELRFMEGVALTYRLLQKSARASGKPLPQFSEHVAEAWLLMPDTWQREADECGVTYDEIDYIYDVEEFLSEEDPEVIYALNEYTKREIFPRDIDAMKLGALQAYSFIYSHAIARANLEYYLGPPEDLSGHWFKNNN